MAHWNRGLAIPRVLVSIEDWGEPAISEMRNHVKAAVLSVLSPVARGGTSAPGPGPLRKRHVGVPCGTGVRGPTVCRTVEACSVNGIRIAVPWAVPRPSEMVAGAAA